MTTVTPRRLLAPPSAGALLVATVRVTAFVTVSKMIQMKTSTTHIKMKYFMVSFAAFEGQQDKVDLVCAKKLYRRSEGWYVTSLYGHLEIQGHYIVPRNPL